MVSFENELTLNYLLSLPNYNDFDDYFIIENKIINHNKKNIISCCLFNNCNKFKNKYLSKFIKLIKWINKNFIDWGIYLYITNDLLEYFKDYNINIFIMKKNKGLIGTFWRFLSIDNDIDKMISIDVDETELNIHKKFIENNISSRYILVNPNYDYYVDKNKTAKKYTCIMAGGFLLCKNDINFNIKDIIIKFLIHQKYYINNERKNIYNKQVGEHINGFGNGLYQYGLDERFLSKFLYFYLVKKGKLLTYHNNTNIKENLEDLNLCKIYNNLIIKI